MKKFFLPLLAAAALSPAQPALAQTNHAVISELYVNTGSGDFIELYNPTSSDIVMTNWTLQYASATGQSFSAKYTFSGTIPKGGFFLVASSGYTGSVTPDKSSGTTLALGLSGGRVVLCDTNVTLSGTAPGQPRMVDFVGYGIAASYEGSGAAQAPGGTNTSLSSLERKAFSTSTSVTMDAGGTHASSGNGYDTDDNSNNFVIRTVNTPQNSSSPLEPERVPPVFLTGFPAASGVSSTGFSLQSTIDEAGTTYYVVLPQNATAPTAVQVKAGQDAAGTPAAIAGSFGHAVRYNTYSKAVSGLSAGTTYRVYVASADSLDNLQTTPTLLTVATPAPLPVALTAFTADLRGTAVVLHWQTAGAPSCREFIAERSADGRQYTEIARLAAAGTGDGPQDYRAIDPAPLAGTSYYRIRQLDYDGTASTSPTRTVRAGGAAAGLQVLPNPFSDRLTILGSETDCLDAAVYDLQGRTRFSGSGTPGALNSRLSEAAAAFEPGVYFLKLHGAQTDFQERLIKQ